MHKNYVDVGDENVGVNQRNKRINLDCPDRKRRLALVH